MQPPPFIIQRMVHADLAPVYLQGLHHAPCCNNKDHLIAYRIMILLFNWLYYIAVRFDDILTNYNGGIGGFFLVLSALYFGVVYAHARMCAPCKNIIM